MRFANIDREREISVDIVLTGSRIHEAGKFTLASQ